MNKRIAIGSDHAGFEHKQKIAELLKAQGFDVVDMGVESAESADYPDYAAKVGRAVSEGEAPRGVLVCGSGIGVSIVANKFSGVRAANCVTKEMAALAREHNDANVLTIGERLVPWEEVPGIVETFLNTPSSENERHKRRIEKIHSSTGI